MKVLINLKFLYVLSLVLSAAGLSGNAFAAACTEEERAEGGKTREVESGLLNDGKKFSICVFPETPSEPIKCSKAHDSDELICQ